MKVPLAGPHQGVPITPEGDQDIFAAQNQQIPQPAFSKPPKQITSQPPPPPPPPESPGILRFLPYVLGMLFLGIIVFLAIRFVPAFFRQTASGPVELTYWGLWEEDSVMNTIIEDYKRENPNIKITYQKQNIKQYRETLNNRLAQGEGPDVFRFHNTWVPMLKDYLVAVPSEVYTKEEFEKTFYPVAAENLLVGNAYVGIPLEIDTLSLFVNEEDFRAAGVPFPKTWKEVHDAAFQKIRVFDSEKRIQKAGIALGTFDNVDHASDILIFMMLQNGVDLKKVDKSLTRDGTRNLGEDVINYYTEFARGNERVWDDTLDSSKLAFAKEKVAMIFGYSWDIFEIRSLNPTLRFKVIPAPRLFDTESLTFASYWVEGVSKNSRHQKEAFAFVKYLSSAETMQKLYSQQAKLRAFGEPYSRIDLAATLKTNPDVAPFLELAPNAVSWYGASNTYDNGINDRMIEYFGNAIRAVTLQNVSPKTALETLAEGINDVASLYGI